MGSIISEDEDEKVQDELYKVLNAFLQSSGGIGESPKVVEKVGDTITSVF